MEKRTTQATSLPHAKILIWQGCEIASPPPDLQGWLRFGGYCLAKAQGTLGFSQVSLAQGMANPGSLVATQCLRHNEGKREKKKIVNSKGSQSFRTSGAPPSVGRRKFIIRHKRKYRKFDPKRNGKEIHIRGLRPLGLPKSTPERSRARR